MSASPVTSRNLTRPSLSTSGITFGRRPSTSSRQKVSSSGTPSSSRHPKDSASPTSLRNTMRCSANSEMKATSMPSSSLATTSAFSIVACVRPEATSDSLASFAASLVAWSARTDLLLTALPPHPMWRQGLCREFRNLIRRPLALLRSEVRSRIPVRNHGAIIRAPYRESHFTFSRLPYSRLLGEKNPALGSSVGG